MRRRSLAPWLFLAPALLIYTAFRVIPMLGTLGLSFAEMKGTASPVLIGLANYERLISDPVFWGAVRNNAIWALGEVVISTAIGLVLAGLLNSRIRLQGLFRTVLFLPVVLAW